MQTHTLLSQSVITVCLKLLHITEEKAVAKEDGTSEGEHKQALLELALEPLRLSQRLYHPSLYLPPWRLCTGVSMQKQRQRPRYLKLLSEAARFTWR